MKIVEEKHFLVLIKLKNVWLIKSGCGNSKIFAGMLSHSFPYECPTPNQNLIPTPMYGDIYSRTKKNPQA